MTRAITVHGVSPVHPGRGEPSRIELHLVLDYLKDTPVESVILSHDQALRLIEQLALAVRAVKP